MPPPDPDETSKWFATELQPHIGILRAWLASQFPDVHEAEDIVQEAAMRVLEAHAASPIRSPRAYLYVVARNLALMRARRLETRGTHSLEDIDSTRILDDSIDIPDAVARTEELQLLTQAIQALPARCRQVLTLRKIYGLSQRETAAELGIAEHTVEIHTAVGLKKVNNYFRERQGGRHQP